MAAYKPEEIVSLIKKAALSKKAYDVRVLDIREVSIISDYFIVLSGSNVNQVKAIAESIEEKLEEKDIRVLRREGMREGQWILLDYGDVVVHIFREQERNFYNIERLWEGAIAVAAKDEAGQTE